jgi:2-iminobutanoate/2-iminopropanoate deaminase
MTSRDGTGQVTHAGNAAAQTRLVLENLKLVLAEGGATLQDVIKITAFICDRADFEAVCQVRSEYFPKDPPAATTVIVAGLADARLLVEIEATAVIDST